MASQHYQSHSCVPVVCTGFHRVQKIKTAEPFLSDCGLHRASCQIKTASKGIIRKECQSFTNHGHAKTPPTVFNPLSLWLTLPLNMGVSHTQWPPSITRAILACLWFAQGLHRNQKSKQQSHSCVTAVCTGFHRVQKIKTAEPFLSDCGLHRVCTASKNQNSRAT